jgi:hypothetical protein
MVHFLLFFHVRFRNPLLYTGVTSEIVKARSLQLEVCMTQKRTQRVFLVAMVHMPLRTAVRRPIRERYPLIPCMNVTIPNNMKIYSAVDLQLETTTTGNTAHPRLHGVLPNGLSLSSSDKRGKPPADEVELEDVVSLSAEDFLRSHLSLCLDDSDEDEENNGRSKNRGQGHLREVRVANGAGSSGASSNTTLDVPSSGDENDDYDDDDLQSVITNGRMSSASSPVDMSGVELGRGGVRGGSVKKKIIPNELLKHAEERDDNDYVTARDVTLDMPAEETVVHLGSEGSDGDISPRSSSSYKHSKSLDHSMTGGLPTDARQKKKIIPAELLSVNSDEVDLPGNGETSGSGDACVRVNINAEGGDEYDLNGHNQHVQNSALKQQQHSPLSQKRRRKLLAADSPAASSSSSPPTHHRLSVPHPSASSSSGSEGLSPREKLSHLSAYGDDSAFSPASRPETPCWDFYDFSEDMQVQWSSLSTILFCMIFWLPRFDFLTKALLLSCY